MKVLTMPIASTFNSQRKYFHCPSQVLAFFEGMWCWMCSTIGRFMGYKRYSPLIRFNICLIDGATSDYSIFFLIFVSKTGAFFASVH